MFPIAMELGPDGAFYVSMPAIGANDGSGVIARIGGDDSTPVAEVNASCAPIPETLYAPPAAESSPAAEAESSPVAAETVATEAPATEEAASSPEASPEVSSSSGVGLTIQGFAFSMPELQVSVGDTVTWTNNDAVPHTATADDGSFDTGSISQGESASITFDTPGTYTYKCAFHPGMTATIVVS
jgi:plastocyanin